MIKNLFLNNWKVKLTSILIALGFWMYVSSIGVQIQEFPGGLPLEIKNLKSGYVAVTDTDRVQVKLIAEKSLWKDINSDKLNTYIDLAGYEPGTYELDIKTQIDIKDVELSEINPSKVLVTIEPEVSKTVPVNVKVEGEAAEGMVAGTPELLPDKVEVIGAKSVIENILEATAVIKINNDSEDVNKVVSLAAYDANNEKIRNIRFNPENITINLPIIKADQTKSVGIKALVQGQPADGFWISSISVIPTSVTITGNSQALVDTNYIETQSINIDGISGNSSFETQLVLPSGVSLIDDSKQVVVNIKLTQNTISKTFNATYHYNNLDEKYQIDKVEPVNLGITLDGPEDIVGQLTSDNIVLNLDMNGFTTGQYTINISKEMFQIPDGISILSYEPSAIKIYVSDK